MKTERPNQKIPPSKAVTEEKAATKVCIWHSYFHKDFEASGELWMQFLYNWHMLRHQIAFKSTLSLCFSNQCFSMNNAVLTKAYGEKKIHVQCTHCSWQNIPHYRSSVGGWGNTFVPGNLNLNKEIINLIENSFSCDVLIIFNAK